MNPGALLLCALCATLAACAGQSKLRTAQLEQIAQWLPGEYDNVAQVETDRRQHRQPHEPLAIAIVPIYAPLIGEHVFYFQEMAADDPRRVTAQRLLSFEVSKDGRIVQSMWTFAEPLRWRDAHRNPEVFKSLQPHDFELLQGCEMLWTKDVERFSGSNDRERCRALARGSSGPVFTEWLAELTADELALGDRSFDTRGQLVYGRTDEPLYRFRRRAGP